MSAPFRGAGGGAALPLLQVQQLRRVYPNGVVANDDVSFDVAQGGIHALVGENGAGKSTVMKMLYGMERPDAGGFLLGGRPCLFRSPRDAIRAGIGLVPQHAQLVPSFTVAESLVLGSEPVRYGALDVAGACREVEEVSQRYGLLLDPRRRIADLSVGERQRVEILKALRRTPRLLLLDEPTAVLTPQQASALYDALRAMAATGISVLLITHRLSEVLDVASSFTVLRAGCVSGKGRSCDVDADVLSRMIVGEDVTPMVVPRRDAGGTAPVLRWERCTVRGAAARPLLDNVCLDVAPGEIVGVAGVEGNGQKTLVDLAAGRLRLGEGALLLDGSALGGEGGMRAARRRGLGLVAEDRLREGMAPGLSIVDNTLALDYWRPPVSRHGILDVAAATQRAREWMASMAVRARDEQVAMGALSGGNMQKVILATELAMRPRGLIACQPTRGVDIGACRRLHQSLVDLRDGGAAVLLISSELDEILALSDRIVVLHGGRIVAHFAAGQASRQTLGLYMTGIAVDEQATGRLGAPYSSAGLSREFGADFDLPAGCAAVQQEFP